MIHNNFFAVEFSPFYKSMVDVSKNRSGMESYSLGGYGRLSVNVNESLCKINLDTDITIQRRTNILCNTIGTKKDINIEKEKTKFTMKHVCEFCRKETFKKGTKFYVCQCCAKVFHFLEEDDAKCGFFYKDNISGHVSQFCIECYENPEKFSIAKDNGRVNTLIEAKQKKVFVPKSSLTPKPTSTVFTNESDNSSFFSIKQINLRNINCRRCFSNVCNCSEERKNKSIKENKKKSNEKKKDLTKNSKFYKCTSSLCKSRTVPTGEFMAIFIKIRKIKKDFKDWKPRISLLIRDFVEMENGKKLYFFPSSLGKIRCCVKCMCALFGISNNTLSKYATYNACEVDGRGKSKGNRIPEEIENEIVSFLDNRDMEPSHYCQGQNQNSYNMMFFSKYNEVSKLYQDAIKHIKSLNLSIVEERKSKYDEIFTLSTFKKILEKYKTKDGCKVRCKKYMTDICNTCYCLKNRIKEAQRNGKHQLVKTYQLQFNIHKAKYKFAFEVRKTLQQEMTKLSCDVLQLDYATKTYLPHTANQANQVFYSSHCSVKNCVLYDCSEKTFMYVCANELICADTANDSCSFFYNSLMELKKRKKNDVLYINIDSCTKDFAGSVVFRFILFIVIVGVYSSVIMHKLVVGHTVMNCDPVGGMIRKKWKNSDVFTMEQIVELAKSLKSGKCVHSSQLEQSSFFDFDRLFKSCGMKKLPKKMVTENKMFVITRSELLETGKVVCISDPSCGKDGFTTEKVIKEPSVVLNFIKEKGITKLEDMKKVLMPLYSEKRKYTQKKQDSIFKLVHGNNPIVPEQYRDYYIYPKESSKKRVLDTRRSTNVDKLSKELLELKMNTNEGAGFFVKELINFLKDPEVQDQDAQERLRELEEAREEIEKLKKIKNGLWNIIEKFRQGDGAEVELSGSKRILDEREEQATKRQKIQFENFSQNEFFVQEEENRSENDKDEVVEDFVLERSGKRGIKVCRSCDFDIPKKHPGVECENCGGFCHRNHHKGIAGRCCYKVKYTSEEEIVFMCSKCKVKQLKRKRIEIVRQ